jgi:predicted nucleic acid-binding protein
VSTAILLDAGPLGLVTNPRESAETRECNAWLRSVIARGDRPMVPEIADYEVRRELLRAGKLRGLQRLDVLKVEIGYLPLTTETMLLAASFWASARRQGKPTAGDEDLDCDMILAAQAATASRRGDVVVIATTNVRHFALFVDARHWRDIKP